MTTTRSEKPTLRIPRSEANWIAVVRLGPVVMPVATDVGASQAATCPIPVTRG